ncbi:sodium-dependent transporter [Bacillus chungangensis]|uniref:NSS family neurotransmitter:Na+ symporter n=1 Tax=Bacillus chungangensis TaxID=587633 RepID=A0ABT9WX82_9BACI|nr:sodium-dependent transporter [Bacillus chungangensis]MDQ0177723.1 NSS family neurotransmitter:Na+ symporter [Bacillus chungangensis]
MDNRPQWGSRAGFIFAAVGSAIGLGNIWRFPAVAYDNGGGAFFLPYLFALLTAGIPLLIMEFTMGHKYRGSSPLTFARISKGSEWIGWWQVGITFVIATYYSIIIAWAMSYTVFSFKVAWGSDPGSFFFNEYLKLGEPGTAGSLVPNALIPLIIVWVIVLSIQSAGIKKGIELANRIFIPLLVFLFLLIVIRALTLDGAIEGINQFFKPDWNRIFDGKVWVAAYGQIFFSLSIGFGIMLTYSSYLPKKSDITNNAFITGFANSSFELLSGIGVFAALGFMASQQGVGIDEVVSSGVGLAFSVFPSIINEMPAFQSAFGILFFLSLLLAGLSSLLSIIETFVAAVQEKFHVNRTTAVLVGGGLAAVISLLYATQGGLFFLDTIDYFINNFGVALAGLFEVVFIAWFVKQLKPIQLHANSVSDIRIGSWWIICLSVITPLVLGYMMYDNLRQNLLSDYEGYPREFIFQYGWSVVIAVILAAALFSMKKWSQDQLAISSAAEKKEVAK